MNQQFHTPQSSPDAPVARMTTLVLRRRAFARTRLTKMKEATNVTKPMREAAKEAETALRLANEIVERILHEDIHDNPTVITAVMLALTQLQRDLDPRCHR